MPKVSIIVPVFNVEKYLQKCIDSLINQTLQDIEIICINDGSKDSSLNILQKNAEKDKRILIIDKENEGVSIARNIGIELAKGEYIGFVDADDWVDPDYFEKMYNSAIKNNCDVACAGFKRCGRLLASKRKKFKKEIIYENINDKLSADNLPENNYLWNKIYKRDKFISSGIKFPEHRLFEDVAVVIKILYYTSKMVVVPNTYYNYRKNQNSIVKKIDEKHKNDLQLAQKELFDFAKEKNIKLDTKTSFNNIHVIKCFGIKLMKIYSYSDYDKYMLLGFIPIFKRRKTN